MPNTIDNIISLSKEIYQLENKTELKITPASIKQIKKAERELDIEFSDELRGFLLKVNGLSSFCTGLDYSSFSKLDEYRYTYEADPSLIEIYQENDDEGYYDWLNSSLIIGGIYEDTLLLLSEYEGTLSYYRYNAAIPGFVEYNTFAEYLENYELYLIEYIKEIEI